MLLVLTSECPSPLCILLLLDFFFFFLSFAVLGTVSGFPN